ncbi:hypothetical protein EJ02DRAFT_435767 [Clathrospora elynae]|uniref:Uncharacterized protein n=1 Tax=Clathrospora elynae TaxID=706981 RepID=A0A6A5SK25_9PLEO|nr:hypothetical protein EJ02DRAFT_435767 [Clathrospora elynae]
MAEYLVTAESPVTPPLPVRNPLRNGSQYQQRPRNIRCEVAVPINFPSSPVSQTIFEEIDRELTGTRERLASAIFEGRRMETPFERESLEYSDTKSWRESMGKKSDGACTFTEFMDEGGSNMSSHEDPYPEQLRPQQLRRHYQDSNAFSHHIEDDYQERAEAGDRRSEYKTTLLSSYNGAASETSTYILSYDGDRSASRKYSAEEEEDRKVEEWLARGIPSPFPQTVAYPRQLSRDCDHAVLLKRPPLSLFPPESKSTGKCEYTPPRTPVVRAVCPMSPLNNGRDAYGNYISSNTRDYFTTQSPPTSPALQPITDGHIASTQRTSSLIVHLRGGAWPKPFWNRAGSEQPNQEPDASQYQQRTDGSGFAQDSRSINNGRRTAARVPPSVRSKYSKTPHDRNAATGDRTLVRPITIDDRRNDIGYDVIYNADPRRPVTHDSTASDGNSLIRANVDVVVNKHFGFPPALAIPISPGTRPLTVQEKETTYGRADVPIRDGPRSPPIDPTFAPLNVKSALAGSTGYPDYTRRPKQPVVDQRPTSFDTIESGDTASTVRTQKYAPREEKRWDRGAPLLPPKGPAPLPPRRLTPEPPEDDGSMYSNDDSVAEASMFSANTADDKLQHLPDLHKSRPYRKAEGSRAIKRMEDARERQRIADEEEEAYRRQQLDRQRLREPDRSTIASSDSVSRYDEPRRPQRAPQAYRMASVREQDSTYSLPRDHPYYDPGPNRQFVQQQQPHSNPIPIPSTTSTVTQLPTINPAHPEKPPLNPLQKTRSLAARVTRYLLAAPSDPGSKTYSRRHPPPSEEQRPARTNQGMGADRSGWPTAGMGVAIGGFAMPIPMVDRDSREPIAERKMGVYPRSVLSGRRRNKEKGKGRAVEHSATTNTQDFADRDAPHQPSFSGTTVAVNHNVIGPALRDAYPGYPWSGGRRIQREGGTVGLLTVPSPAGAKNKTRNEHDDPRYETSDVASTANTLFPDQDSMGNVFIPHAAPHQGHLRYGIRGGGAVDAVPHSHIANLRGGDVVGLDAALEAAARRSSAGDEELPNMRSSFSTDSVVTVDSNERREKERKKKTGVGVNEDWAGAMARDMAVHSLV